MSAAKALGKLGNTSPEVVDGLVAALRDEDGVCRKVLRYALVKLRSTSPELVVGLVAALRDRDERVSRDAAAVLGTLGSLARKWRTDWSRCCGIRMIMSEGMLRQYWEHSESQARKWWTDWWRH